MIFLLASLCVCVLVYYFRMLLEVMERANFNSDYECRMRGLG